MRCVSIYFLRDGIEDCIDGNGEFYRSTSCTLSTFWFFSFECFLFWFFFNEFVYIEKTIKESFTHLHLYYNKHRHFNKQKTGKVKLTAVVCV